MGSFEPTTARGWRGRAVRRLQRLADALDPDELIQDAELVETEDVDDEVDDIEPVDVFDHERRAAAAAERAGFARRAEFRAVVREVYPSVAPAVIALAEGGCDADLDDWLTVARLLYDDVTHRDGGLSAEARERALRAAAAQALEAQARSSARLAGYTDAQQDERSTIEGDAPGTLVWEHYLCREAKLVRENLHGETLGHWLAALGELWSAASLLYRLDTEAVGVADAELVDDVDDTVRDIDIDVATTDAAEAVTDAGDARPGADLVVAAPTAGPEPADAPAHRRGVESAEHERARIALRAALARVEELALW